MTKNKFTKQQQAVQKYIEEASEVYDKAKYRDMSPSDSTLLVIARMLQSEYHWTKKGKK